MLQTAHREWDVWLRGEGMMRGMVKLEGWTRVQPVESEDASIGDGQDGTLHFEPLAVSRGVAGSTAGEG